MCLKLKAKVDTHSVKDYSVLKVCLVNSNFNGQVACNKRKVKSTESIFMCKSCSLSVVTIKKKNRGSIVLVNLLLASVSY
jgi:hypothetical protein